MDFEKLLAEAEKIADPVEREKELNRIISLMIGSPARAATTMPYGLGATDPTTVVDPADQIQIRQDVDLAKKLQANPRMENFTDEELEKVIGGFSSTVPATEAVAEQQIREEIDEAGISRVANPNYLKRLAGNVVAGAAEIPTTDPLFLTGLLGKGLEFITQQPLVKDGKGNTILTADDLIMAGSEIRNSIRADIGISEERDIGESAAGLVPAIIPIGGKAPATVLGNIAEIVTPLTIGAGSKRILANFATAAVAEQAIREIADDETSPYRTLFDVAGLTGEEETAHPEAATALMTGFGLLAGASIVGPIAVKTMREAKALRAPTSVDIVKLDPFAPKNLKSIETAGDLYKTYLVDEKQVLADIATRAGVPDPDTLIKMIDSDTQMSAVMRVNEALRTGKLRTKAGSFAVETSPDQLLVQYRKLPPVMQQDADMYMKYLDLMDTMRMRIAEDIDVDNSKLVFDQARRSVYEIEQRTPVVKDFASRYKTITGAVRKFLSEGDNAMLSKKQLETLDKQRANFVPTDVKAVNPNQDLLSRIADTTTTVDSGKIYDWYLQRTDLERVTDLQNRANSFEALRDYTHNALKTKMEQDVRGGYIRALQDSKYGTETVRPVAEGEAGKFRDRTVEIFVDGERKKFLTSKLQKQLLEFDPYVAKFPNMYALKRLFEHGTTGPLSITFAPITALRDSLAGWVFMPRDMKGPGSLAVAAAVPKQVWAKTQRAAIEVLKSGMDLPFIDDIGKDLLARQISNSYMNSMYHLANEAGGFDASLMKTNIQNARGIFHEILQSTDAVASKVPGLRTLGHSLQAMAHGWSNIFNAIQEAPRFATFERNVKAGMDPSMAVTEARKLTGDTTRSGRVYDPSGIRIDADAVNKSLKAFASPAGWTIEALRETTPYVNPMIQGLRRAGNAFIDDPVKTNIRAWTAVGLPAAAALGWNEMLGEEYNKFAFEQRNSRDIAMNLYIGVPGLPPEQGISIPFPHELTMFKSPFETGLYSMMKGSEGDETQKMMMHMAGTALENTAMVGFPVPLQQAFNLSGYKAPESILTPMDDTYALREDNVGMLPQNIELLVRNTFGGVSDSVLASAAAFWDGGPEAFFEEFGARTLQRLPIVKGPLGNTTPVTNFTPFSQEKQNKVEALNEFITLWEDHFDPRREGKLRVNSPPDTKGLSEEGDIQTTANFAPLPTPKPVNPVYQEYGAMIKDILDGNSEGYSGIKSRYGLVSEQIRLLKGYNAGKKDMFREWQKTYEGADAQYQAALQELEERKATLNKNEYKKALKEVQTQWEDKAKADRYVKENKLDLSKRSDVTKLLSALERERSELMNMQVQLIETVEDRLTQDMQARGIIPLGKKFKVEKHLRPSLQGL